MGLKNIRYMVNYENFDAKNKEEMLSIDDYDVVTTRANGPLSTTKMVERTEASISRKEYLQGIGAVYGYDLSHYSDEKLAKLFVGVSQYITDQSTLFDNYDEKAVYTGDLTDSFQKQIKEFGDKMIGPDNDAKPAYFFTKFIRSSVMGFCNDYHIDLESEEQTEMCMNRSMYEVDYMLYYDHGDKMDTMEVALPNMTKEGSKDEISVLDVKKEVAKGKAEYKNLFFREDRLTEKLNKLNDSKTFGNSSSYKKILEAAQKYNKLFSNKEANFSEKGKALSEKQMEALGELKKACDDYLDAKDKQHGFVTTKDTIKNGQMPHFKTEGGKLRYQEISNLSKLLSSQLDREPETNREKRLSGLIKPDTELTKVQRKDLSRSLNKEKDMDPLTMR